MKKIISSILVCALLVCTLFTLASCGKTLSGKYYAEQEVNLVITKVTARLTYEFKASGEVTLTTVYGTDNVKESETIEGTYEINEVKDGEYEITFVWVDGDEQDTAIYSFTEGKDSAGKYIEIAGQRYDAID